MIQDMKTTLTRLFTVMMLIMVSMGAMADVKVLFGEKGTELQPGKDGTITLGQKELTGGTIIIFQEEQKDGTSKVTFAVTPDKNYKLAENGLEVYAVIPTDISSTRGLEVSTTLTLKSEDFKDISQKRTYTVDIDSKLALWIKKAEFTKKDGESKGGERSISEDLGYSGTYYIGSNAYDGNPANTNNYYLCPTEGWAFFVSEGTPYCTVQGTDNGQPFLTTYQIKKTGYDRTKAKWTITKIANSEYYYIQQTLTKKYLVVNGAVSSNPDRARIHLEDISENDLDERAQFAIYLYSGHIVIKSISIDEKQSDVPSGSTHFGTHDDHKWLTVNQGNKPNLNGTNAKTDGPSDFPNTGGIIGIFTESDAKGDFYLEDYITRPTITYNSSNLIEITPAQTGTVTIKYTTDGSTPSTSNGVTYSAPFDPDDDVTTIKAIVIVNGEESNVATFKPIVLLGTSHKRLIQNQGDPWNETDFHFYMIPGDEVEGITKVNTTSLFRPSMEWYFLNAGVESDIQYYYIVNNVNGKSLCYDETNIVYMANNDNSNKFKFSIAEPTTAGTYNIIPYGVTKKFIQKESGNGSVNPVFLKSESYNTSNNQYARWKFILPTELNRNAPFTASDPTNLDYHYFTITTSTTNNNVTTTYYLAPGTANVQTLTSSDASALWYFEVVQAADATDWLTYYHIRNAVTGDYLYFDIESYNANTTSSCFKTSTTIEGNAERYKFTWAKTASASVNYYIVPKLMKDASQNTISTLYRNSNTNIRLDQTRSTGTRVWNFESTTYNCAQPEITWSDGENGYVITASEPDAKIYYMIGEGELTPSSGTLYTSAIPVAELSGTTATIRAIAARNSDDSDASTVASVTVSKVETPTITLSDGTVQISCATAGASIYYEIGNTADGVSTPTSSSTPYSGPIENAAGKYIKAIAVKGGWINSAIASSAQIEFPCAKPVIRKASATTFTITCSFPTSGVAIYYTKGTNPADPTTSSTRYEGAVSFTASELPFTVKAIAVASNYANSEIATLEITEGLTLDNDDYYIIASNDDFKKFITMAGGTDSDKKYKITADIDATATSAIETTFTGELMGVAKADGTFPVISNLSHPIFYKIDGGIVKNITLELASTWSSSGTNAGAIAKVVEGTSDHMAYIYNCGILSGSVSGSGDVGGLVGVLGNTSDDTKCYARVINCYSFADVSGGTNTGGIVGNNTYASKSSDVEGGSIRTMVMNCMFYGTGNNIYPIYGGQDISNENDSRLNNYNYFSYDNLSSNKIAQYNRALAAEGRYLDRFEFYRMMLNSNRELAAYYIDPSPTTEGSGDKEVKRYHQDLMAKWVLDKSIAQYPILKNQATYPSVVNYDPDYTYDEKTGQMVLRTSYEEKDRNKGRYLGDLSVTISGVGTNAASGAKLLNENGVEITGSRTITLKRTDKDYDDYNFNYNKVQLPYYNDYGTKNYTDNKVVTGWEVSFTGAKAVTAGEDITFDSNGDITDTPYNFADRKAVTGRVFAQGAYFDVPDGVSSITIMPHWAKAVYLSDATYDCYGYGTSNGVTDFGKKFVGGEEYSINGDEQVVYTDISTALTNLSRGSSVYDYAVVLVGNYHKQNTPSNDGSPYTIMSADLNFDNEPDYSLIINSGKQEVISPIRFDFVNVIGTSMAHKQSGAKMGILGNMKPRGWFEVTNTAIIRFSQFEYDYDSKSSSPLILLGGVVEQFVSTNATDAEGTASHTQYIHVGSNVWFQLFSNGCHMDKKNVKTPHRPISVTGGDYEKFYLSGYFKPDAPSYEDHAECYIDGGRFGEVAGAGQEKIQGNVTWIINHADITSFFGGGINDKKPIGGNVRVDINNSYVDLYCGGPKFGDMAIDADNSANNKTVTTNADNCNFGTYFGAGYGGTALFRDIWSPGGNKGHNQYQSVDYPWTSWLGDQYGYNPRGRYEAGKGIAVSFEYEHFEGSQDNWTVARLYVYFASLSLAQTNDVTSNLTNCIVRGDYYGGGNLGKVNGDITNNIDGCTIYGNVFGGGFSATVPTAEVFNDVPANLKTPVYNVNTGVFEKGDYPDKQILTWSTNGSNTTGSTLSAVNATEKWIHTDAANLEGLGVVDGDVFVNISNSTYVRGMVGGNVPEPDNGFTGIDGKVLYGIPINGTTEGGVFGGGDASAVNGNTTVTVNNTNTNGINNVFGGGNDAKVDGNTEVNLHNGVINGNVFGGGNKGVVSGTATVNIE